ncbi:MAG: hypothetical protein R6W97_03540 [Thiobacillus sp.]
MNLLSRLSFLGRRPPDAPFEPDLDEALERAAARVEPRLKQTRGWPKRFRRPISDALAQARRVAEAIPGPVDIDAAHFARDPFVHALFGSPEDIRRALCSSRVMHDYVDSGIGSEAYVLLSMRREEKRTLGMENAGSVLNRDVPQRLVWFSDHQLIAPAPTLAQARENLRWTLFDRFLERLAGGVDCLRAERNRLAEEKDHALARLRRAGASQRPELQVRAENSLRQLGEATRCLEHENLVEIFGTVLSHPEDCLFLREQVLRIDNMGVVHSDEGKPDDVPPLRFAELIERYHEPRTVVLVHCPDIHPMTQEERLREAERWLG